MSRAQSQHQKSQIPYNSNSCIMQQVVKFFTSTFGNHNEKAETCNQKLPPNNTLNIQPIQILRSKLNQIQYYIYKVGDRNKVYKCNYIHLHIALAITIKLLQIQIISSKNTYIQTFLNTLIKKINQRQEMFLQISDKKYREAVSNTFFKLIIKKNANQKELIAFLRNFLLNNKDIMMSFMPYYYNFFALVVNKQDVFMSDKPSQALLQYTIDFQHDKFYNKNFKRSDIQQMIEIFEEKLTQKYHCIQA